MRLTSTLSDAVNLNVVVCACLHLGAPLFGAGVNDNNCKVEASGLITKESISTVLFIAQDVDEGTLGHAEWTAGEDEAYNAWAASAGNETASVRALLLASRMTDNLPDIIYSCSQQPGEAVAWLQTAQRLHEATLRALHQLRSALASGRDDHDELIHCTADGNAAAGGHAAAAEAAVDWEAVTAILTAWVHSADIWALETQSQLRDGSQRGSMGPLDEALVSALRCIGSSADHPRPTWPCRPGEEPLRILYRRVHNAEGRSAFAAFAEAELLQVLQLRSRS